MWTDDLSYASGRVHRRRLVLGLALGVLAGGAAVAAALGFMPVAAIAVLGVAVGGGGWLLGSSAERALSHRLGSAPKSVHLPLSLEAEESPLDRQEVRETRVGALGHFRVTAHALVIETLLSTTGTRIEDLAPCLSAIRSFAGHVALGWDTSLADSWETDRAAFVASVQARLGRVSGPGGTA